MESENNTCFDDLPEGLVMDILSRLPLKSVIRSTFVRKDWYSIIKSLSFISLHFSRSAFDPRSYVFLTNRFSCMFGLFKDNQLLTHDSPECSIFEFIIRPNPRKEFISACRGLVCIAGDGYGIYLVNPFVRKYKEIALVSSCYADLIREMKPNNMEAYKGIHIDFGYSEIEDDYKVLRMIVPYNKKRGTKVEIYSLNSGEWKIVDHSIKIEIDFFVPVGVCVLGSLYWLIQNDTRYLLCFDLKAQVFSKIELPKPYMNLSTSRLLNKNDSLVILLHEQVEDRFSGELEMCLLMLEEKNLEGHKWKACSYTVSRVSLFPDGTDIFRRSCPEMMSLGFTIGGSLVFKVQDTPESDYNFLVAVDLDNKCSIEKFKFDFKEHFIEGLDGIIGTTNVLESLVLFSG